MTGLRGDAVFVTEVDGQMVVLESSTSTYFTANAVGNFILTSLRDGTSVAQLPALIATRFDVDLATARQDVDQFVVDLDRRGWLDDDQTSPPVE